MNRTREDFCRKLLDDDSPHDTLNPEDLAARFVRYFRLSGRPALDELRSMLRRAGFGEVTGRDLDVKGIHYGALGGRLRHPLPGRPVGRRAGVLGAPRDL